MRYVEEMDKIFVWGFSICLFPICDTARYIAVQVWHAMCTTDTIIEDMSASLSKNAVSDFIQTTFFNLGRFLTKLADNQCPSITKGSIYLPYKTFVHTTFYHSTVDWPEIWHLMEVCTMFYICRCCVFTLFVRCVVITQNESDVGNNMLPVSEKFLSFKYMSKLKPDTCCNHIVHIS